MESKDLRVVECYDLPENPDLNTVYKMLPKNPDEAFYKERTDRNIGWITPEEQQIVKNSVVGVAGCGGIGGQLAEKFLRLGVGEIRIADIELFDISNINRQFGAARSNVGKPKAFATAKMLREVSDDFTLVVYPHGICSEIIEGFVPGCNVICDEIEFWAVDARIILHRCARTMGVPVINCNTVGFRTLLFLFTPTSSTMEELLGFTLEEAIEISQSIRRRTATKEMIKRVMDSVIRGLIPEVPPYGVSDPTGKYPALTYRRLFEEGRASIIATNPPVAAGFVSGRVLLYLIRNSGVKRPIEEMPEMPGYIYLDAATVQAKIMKGKWW
jgi:molybdopterin/thiamine biosynthesis adenylyltransferase